MKIPMLVAVTVLTVSSAGAQTTPRQLRLAETLRIDGAKEDLAGDIPNLWVGPRGQIAVFDSPNARFVFFDSTGKRQGTFGARGEGPGEFAPVGGTYYSLPNGVVGDTMWAYASNRRRFTLIGPDLKLARTLPLPRYDAASIAAFLPLALLANDRIVGRAVFASNSDTAIIIMAANGSVERRVAAAQNSSTVAPSVPGGQRVVFTVPFLSTTHVAASANGDRVAIATSSSRSPSGGEYTVTVVRASGDTVFSITRAYASAAVTKAMADSQMSVRARQAERGGGTDQLGSVRERIPPSLPAFSSMEVGFDGSIWLRRYAAGGTPPEFIVFSATGEALGELRFNKAGIALHRATRSTIWTTETDADGFFSVVRYRVEQQ